LLRALLRRYGSEISLLGFPILKDTNYRQHIITIQRKKRHLAKYTLDARSGEGITGSLEVSYVSQPECVGYKMVMLTTNVVQDLKFVMGFD
jgi:hypothetical protein